MRCIAPGRGRARPIASPGPCAWRPVGVLEMRGQWVVSLPVVLCIAVVGIGMGLWRVRHPAPSLPPGSQAAPRPAGELVPILDPSNPCGPVAASLVGHLVGKPVSLAEARRAVPADSLGRTSAAALIAGLKQLGMTAAAVRMPVADARKLDVPYIAFIRRSHFVVLVPCGRGEVLMMDPPQRAERRTLTELACDWDGEAVLVAPDAGRLAANLARLGLSLPEP